jgi:hypothetical protein
MKLRVQHLAEALTHFHVQLEDRIGSLDVHRGLLMHGLKKEDHPTGPIAL